MNKLTELEKKLLDTIIATFVLNSSKICLEFYQYLKLVSKKNDLHKLISYITENKDYINEMNQNHNTYNNDLFTAYLALEISIKKVSTSG